MPFQIQNGRKFIFAPLAKLITKQWHSLHSHQLAGYVAHIHLYVPVKDAICEIGFPILKVQYVEFKHHNALSLPLCFQACIRTYNGCQVPVVYAQVLTVTLFLLIYNSPFFLILAHQHRPTLVSLILSSLSSFLLLCPASGASFLIHAAAGINVKHNHFKLTKTQSNYILMKTWIWILYYNCANKIPSFSI